MLYKPDFELAVPAGNRPDENKPEDIESLIRTAKGKLPYTARSIQTPCWRVGMVLGSGKWVGS